MEGCTPNMGVNLWSESPLYENPKVFIQMDPDKSTSQRQGRLREEGSEESLCANVRGDEQKPHTRLSLQANWHNTTKPTGLGDRVNAAFAHGKFTYLSLHATLHALHLPELIFAEAFELLPRFWQRRMLSADRPYCQE